LSRAGDARRRKSVEPLAAVTAPARVSAQHQALLHFVANAPWSDAAALAKVRELVQPALECGGPIEAWLIGQRVDVQAAMECVRLCRKVGNAFSFRNLTKREAYPRSVGDVALEEFVRNAAVPFWHYTCSAKMGYLLGQNGIPARPKWAGTTCR
jgi:hypothetical protein